MSWFGRDSPLRSSFSRRKGSFTPLHKIHEGACLEVFRTHWQQAWSIMEKYGHGNIIISSDDINIVVNLLDQMTTLLLQEMHNQSSQDNHCNDSSNGALIGSILGYFLAENCLDKLFIWSTHTGEYNNFMKEEQLKFYEVLVSNCHQDLLFHKPIVRPLLRLLASCRECVPVGVEKRLVILLNTLCVCLTQFPDLLQVFFYASSDQGSTRSEHRREMFLIFSLLIPFVHREGAIGQQARDALLLCMSLSRKNTSVGTYIAEHSNFCPVLATGLSGLYSVLPRKLSVVSEDWHHFTAEDISTTPELSLFLNSLEFCNAVVQVAHPMVQEQLLEYLYQGFLVPVLGPALHQSTLEEVIATTAYLELFLRTVTEPILLQVFLKFILTATHDDHAILNTLIDRLGAQGQLCLVNMSLFQRLLDLNCEEVLFQLVLRFLIPCSHIMISQRARICDIDIYTTSAEKFLALIPECINSSKLNSSMESQMHFSLPSLPREPRSMSFTEQLSRGGSLRISRHHRSPSTLSFSEHSPPTSLSRPQGIESLNSSYIDYLKEAHESIKSCTIACWSWSSQYDGFDPTPQRLRTGSGTQQSQASNSVIFNGLSQAAAITKKPNEIRISKPCSLAIDQTSQKLEHPSSASTSSQSSVKPATLPIDISARKTETTELLSQIMYEEDEGTFWNLISSTKTPSSTSDLDDCLEMADIHFGEAEMASCSKSGYEKLGVDATEVLSKDEASNLDSGVFESRESNSSSDRDNDAEPATVQHEDEKPNDAPCSTVSISSKNDGTKSQEESKKNAHEMSGTSTCWETFPTPDVGPFLSILLTRLEMMMQNDLYTNLHLTGLISRLAQYPQPLLRSFLLNHTLVFQPTVRSLLQVLGSLKHKIDSYSCTVENFEELVIKCKLFLLAREEHLPNGNTQKVAPVSFQKTQRSVQRGEKRNSLTSFLFRKKSFLHKKGQSFSKEPTLLSIGDGNGYRYIPKPSYDAFEGEMESLKTRNAILCAIVLEEFLKELASIAQEHSVIQLDPYFWDPKWQL